MVHEPGFVEERSVEERGGEGWRGVRYIEGWRGVRYIEGLLEAVLSSFGDGHP